MIKQALTIENSTTAQPTISAGWLAGDDTASWLNEVALCARQGITIKGFSVAQSTATQSTAGLLLIPNSPEGYFSPRVQPLTEIAPRVYTLVGFDLSIDLTNQEQKYLFPYDYHFFHPVFGLVGFAATEQIKFEQLLALPPETETNWQSLLSGPPPSPRFQGISVIQPNPIDDLIDAAGSDISSEANMTPKKGGGKAASGRLGSLGKGAAGGAILGLSKLRDLLPSSPASSLSQEQSNKYLEWAQKNWDGLFDARKREINSLLDKLSENLDEGLKYALPLNGDGINRGIAPPSTRLGKRSNNFSMGGGGGPADHWDLSYEHQLALEQKYREAALQEIGRHNYPRAAYIYGNLLGDWSAAANAMERGKQYRDAISFYLHKLDNKAAAAACYEKGAMLSQAADLYIEISNFEKAGDLHNQMGDEQAARALWIKASDHERDPIKRATLWSEKLKQDAMALEILDQQWPTGDRSSEGADMMFRLLERSNNTEAAIKLGNRILNHHESINSFGLDSKLKFIQAATKRWGNAELTQWMQQETWQRVGDEIASEKPKSERYLEFLTAITPEDRLLARDVQRYKVPKHSFKPKIYKTPLGELSPKKIIEIPLPGATWMSIARKASKVSIVGRHRGVTALANWDKSNDNWATASQLINSDLPEDQGQIEHIAIGLEDLELRVLRYLIQKRAYCHNEKPTRNSTLDQITSVTNVLAVGQNLDNSTFLLLRYTETGSLSILKYTQQGELNEATPVDIVEPKALERHWLITGTSELTVIASQGLLACRSRGLFTTLSLSGLPKSLEICPISGEALLLVAGNEVTHITYNGVGKPLESVNLYTADSEDPALNACFLTDGSIAITHSNGGEIFSANQFLKLQATIKFEASLGEARGIVNYGAGQFLILLNSGKLLYFDYQ